MPATLELLPSLNAAQLRALAGELIAQAAQREHTISRQDQLIASKDEAIASKDNELKSRQIKIDQLTHEMAVLKRWKFGSSSEQLNPAQLSLLDETIHADIAAIELELKDLAPAPKAAA